MALAPVKPLQGGDRFALGRLVWTPGAKRAIEAAGDDPFQLLSRHATGDWGAVDPEDAERNETALRDGTRLLSAYETSRGTRIWVITEAAF